MAKKINELFFMRPWAVKEDVLMAITNIIQQGLKGEKSSQEVILAKTDFNKNNGAEYEVKNGIARIPIYGVISKHISLFQYICGGGASIKEITKNFKAALKDKAVEKILLDIDSPGGSVDGNAELSDLIFNSRGKKSIIAYANGQMDSAAYWIGSAADKIYTSKSAEVGSIGVFAVISDWSILFHNAGIKNEIIKAGKYKATGHPLKTFTQEDRGVVQEEVDSYYELFVDAVKRNRMMSAEEVSKVAIGKVFVGQKAVDIGLADSVENLDNLFDASPEGSKAKASDSKEKLITCRGCGKELKYSEHQEVAMGAIKCPECSEVINQEGTVMQNANVPPIKKEERTMDFKSLTVELLKKERPDLVEALHKEMVEAAAEAKKTADEEATNKERARVLAIMEKSKPYDKIEGIEIVIKEAIEKGHSVEITEGTFKTKKIEALEKSAPPLLGPNSGDENKDINNAGLTLKEQCEKTWKEDPKIRQEFSSKESYFGYMRAKKAGRVRILGDKK